MENDMKSFLRKFREKADMTQGELADVLGVSRQSVISLESGKCVPSVNLAVKIASVFDVPIEFIFRFDESFLPKSFAYCEQETEAENENDEDKKNNPGGSMRRDLTTWSPWREMMSLRETMDRFFDEPAGSRGSGVFYPSIGIRETANELIVEADLPGVKEGDVEIELEDNQLLIKGERRHSEESRREEYYHLESSYGAFSRIIALPGNVDSSKTEAEFDNGILKITIPKLEERKPRKIAVKPVSKKSEAAKPKIGNKKK